MSVPLHQAQAIAAGIVGDLVGEAVNFSNVAFPLAIYPQQNSGGERATQVILRPGSDIWLKPSDATTADANGAPTAAYVPAVVGPPSAQLFGGSTYVFNLSPFLNTLSFIHPTGASLGVIWVIGD